MRIRKIQHLLEVDLKREFHAKLAATTAVEPGRLPYLAAANLTGWRRWVPGWKTIQTYQPAWLKA